MKYGSHYPQYVHSFAQSLKYIENSLTIANIKHCTMQTYLLVLISIYNSWLADFTLTFHFPALEKEMATQCSCLENPRDRGAWWASVSGVAQSQTRLKRLSSSSSNSSMIYIIMFLFMY